jgi:hypothetical protein
MVTKTGTKGNDVLKGTSCADTLIGLKGNDSLIGLAGDDKLLGGKGNDQLKGDTGNDSVIGNNGNDILWGSSGNDILSGGSGNDLLAGGEGTDKLTGGKGEDVFVLESSTTLAKADIITDFTPGQDKLSLSGLTYSNLKITQGKRAHAKDTLINDKLSGQVLAVLRRVNSTTIDKTDFISSPANAENFTITKIVDTANSPLEGFSSPAINNNGTVTFKAYLELDTEAEGIFTSNGGSLTTITDTSGSLGFLLTPSINNSGTVAFKASFDGGTLNGVGPGVGIFTGNGGPLTTISLDADASGILVSNPAINDSGTVTFADNESGDIFTGSGGPLTLITNANGGNPTINNQGTVAVVVPGASLLTFNDGATTTIANTSGSFDSLSGDGSPINNNGTVAFKAFLDLDTGAEGIFTSSGGPLTTIADTSGPFSSFIGSPAINDQGTVAFFAGLDAGGAGIFTGPDPIADKVIATGDTFLGSTVTNIESFNLERLNDLGQITFVASLADATTGIFVAQPVTL